MNDLTLKARSVFADDRYATVATGIEIDHVDNLQAVCGLTLGDTHRNAKGAVMGGVLFTLADFAFAVAANSAEPSDNGDINLCWVSSTSTINFLNPVKGERLVAKTECIKKGKTQTVYKIDIADNTGVMVATVITTGLRVHQQHA